MNIFTQTHFFHHPLFNFQSNKKEIKFYFFYPLIIFYLPTFLPFQPNRPLREQCWKGILRYSKVFALDRHPCILDANVTSLTFSKQFFVSLLYIRRRLRPRKKTSDLITRFKTKFKTNQTFSSIKVVVDFFLTHEPKNLCNGFFNTSSLLFSLTYIYFCFFLSIPLFSPTPQMTVTYSKELVNTQLLTT